MRCLCMSSCHSASDPENELGWSCYGSLPCSGAHFIERNTSGVMVLGSTGKPLCQELMVNLAGPEGKMEYTSTERGHLPPLTLVASPPGWDDYLDLGQTVTKIANHLIEEDGQQAKMPPKAGTTPRGKISLRLRHYHQATTLLCSRIQRFQAFD